MLLDTPHVESEIIIDEKESSNSVEITVIEMVEKSELDLKSEILPSQNDFTDFDKNGEIKNTVTANSISENLLTEIAIVEGGAKMIVENEVVNEVVNEMKNSAIEELKVEKEEVPMMKDENMGVTEVEKDVEKDMAQVVQEEVFVDDESCVGDIGRE